MEYDREAFILEIDELKYKLKSRHPEDSMLEDFNSTLNAFIERWSLSSDPHTFVKLPQI